MSKKIARLAYFDWASAALVSQEAHDVFIQALKVYGNPSSPHAEGVRAKIILEEARKTIAKLAAVKPDGIIFTSGATEANALAIRGHVRARVIAGMKLNDMHLLYLPTAHSSVIETMETLGVRGAQIEPLVIKESAIDLEALKSQVRPETVLVSMDSVCGETGTTYASRDVRRVLDACYREQSSKDSSLMRPLLHVDASQVPLTGSINHSHLGADLMTLDAQKVGGVRGVGVLVRAHASQALLPLAPIMQGGGQEYGLRPGTENPALAAAFAAALREAEEGREEFAARASEARAAFLDTLTTAFPDEPPGDSKGFVVNVGKEYSPHTLNLSFIGRDTDYAVMLLSKAGYAVSTKSACETDAVGSRVVFALTGDEARSLSTLRISWGPSTKPQELRALAKELIRTIQFLDSHPL